MSFKRGFIQTSFWVMIIIMAASCIQGPGGGKRKTASKVVEASSSDTYTPDFSENTYTRLKNQSDETTSTLTINIDFNDNIYMLGRDVHNFISNGNQSSAQCLVAHYNSTLVTNKILVIAVRPNYFLNFSTGLKEYYYLIAPSDSNTNKAFCQKTGIIGQMNAIYPGETIAYSLSELSVATTTSIITDHFALYSIGGSHISTVKTDNLSLKINAQTSIVDPVKSCTTTDQCIAKGYDCCSTYQCVNDGELKDGTDTSSSDYLQAVSDIQNNNATFRDYPNFFHICGVNIPPTPSPTPTVNPADEAARRLQELKELYECTTLLEGEMSICTATHSNVSQNTIYETGKDDRNFRTTQPDTSTLPDHSITEIIYSGETLFAYGEVYNPSNGKFTISQKNDTITDAAAVTITASPGDNAPNNDLRIRYKIDGSCKQINSQLAKCTKYYVQGQNSSPARIDDHPDGTDVFLLPLYADITKQINVEVDGIYKIKNIHWEIATGSPSSVRFTGTGQQVYDTQSVTITYYVSSGSIGDVLQQKQTSVERIDAICDCG
ncbi:MAG: hypothetical protein KAQ98_14710, partial [Bacteriovoracaceae bacterium]|nr:hypothetical protein [Bacteriovoracaceae bacterium]